MTTVSGRARAGNHRLPDTEYQALLDAQGGRCALCPSQPKTRRLHVDRDHRTGQVRGLLCMRCNRNLPEWVTPTWLFAAFKYLSPDVERVWIDRVPRRAAGKRNELR